MSCGQIILIIRLLSRLPPIFSSSKTSFEMKSKEETLRWALEQNNNISDENAVYDAMDEYAKQEAEAYEKWLCDSRYIRKLFPLSAPFADLWSLYLESKKQKV